MSKEVSLTDEITLAVAKAIASGLGYDYESLYEGKSEYIADRGSRHDINTPYKTDMEEAAEAAIKAYEEAKEKT
jgi:hypothetical protein